MHQNSTLVVICMADKNQMKISIRISKNPSQMIVTKTNLGKLSELELHK